MTSPLPSLTPAEPHGGTGELGWLLVNFLQEVPGAEAAVLGTLDGLPLASAGLAEPQPDHLAAIATTLHSSGRSAGNITDPPGGGVQLVLVQLNGRHVFVMHTQRGGVTDADSAGTLLSVLAVPTADTRMVGSEMTRLITSVARHLGTATRTSTDNSGAGAGNEG